MSDKSDRIVEGLMGGILVGDCVVAVCVAELPLPFLLLVVGFGMLGVFFIANSFLRML